MVHTALFSELYLIYRTVICSQRW